MHVIQSAGRGFDNHLTWSHVAVISTAHLEYDTLDACDVAPFNKPFFKQLACRIFYQASLDYVDQFTRMPFTLNSKHDPLNWSINVSIRHRFHLG